MTFYFRYGARDGIHHKKFLETDAVMTIDEDGTIHVSMTAEDTADAQKVQFYLRPYAAASFAALIIQEGLERLRKDGEKK